MNIGIVFVRMCRRDSKKGDEKMKHIETHLTERHFLSRLETLCRKQERFDRGDRENDYFVVKRNNQKFRIAKHYAHVGKTDGYGYDCLYCQGICHCRLLFQKNANVLYSIYHLLYSRYGTLDCHDI